ncbi:capsular biosynthesis protein [Ammoniphilus oxalaticus]|uniref:Capsular biosynthesis protein n=1 Tax=Ammoniphilus oxalaticus TaxID=66863 RepID=A0A419SHJ9_9BACL|nr:capsular biosynthesis protein [Ammoniphilus oxalaticus]
MRPAISIIVPVYNDELHLRACVDSLLTQSFTDFEIILVNDGSTDGSGKICDDFAVKDARVRVIHKHNGGVSSARNIGVAAARGEYIGFVDGDDRIETNMYVELHTLCVETDSDIAICRLGREINGELMNNDPRPFVKELDHNEAIARLFEGVLYRFSLCNKLFKKTCFEGVSFPEGRIHEDLSSTYRLFANANKAIYSNFIGYIYVKRENSILTSTYSEKRLDAFLGWDEILTFMNDRYKHLTHTVITCFLYWCIDNVFYILKQVENRRDRNQYLGVIQQCVKKHYKEIMSSKISMKHRMIITLLNYNVRLLTISYSLRGAIFDTSS